MVAAADQPVGEGMGLPSDEAMEGRGERRSKQGVGQGERGEANFEERGREGGGEREREREEIDR